LKNIHDSLILGSDADSEFATMTEADVSMAALGKKTANKKIMEVDDDMSIYEILEI